VSLSSLENAISKKVQDEADAILDQARKDADARFERESARMREEHERRITAARAELETTLERETSARKTADRLKLLTIKNEILEAVFAGAIEKIRRLPRDGYAEWLKRQLASLPPMTGSGIAVNALDAEVAKRLVAELPADAGLSFDDEPARIQAGFIVRGEQADLDYSVEVLLGVLREKLAQQIATRLFGEEGE